MGIPDLNKKSFFYKLQQIPRLSFIVKPSTVRDGRILGHCSKFGAIANFKFGAMPQIWVKSQFSTWKMNGKICYQQAIIIHRHVQTIVVYSYVLH